MTAAQWDLRTFHLLHTVPALDQCRLVFNSNATIMYAGTCDQSAERSFLFPNVSSFVLGFVQLCCRLMTRPTSWTSG